MQLDGRLIKQCLEQPETGMGWQDVKVHLVDGRILPGHVYGSEELNLFDEEPLPLYMIMKIEAIPRRTSAKRE